jgi:small basic protein (TIGR04137 family)
MSMDKSLRAKSSLERHRNVLTRAERIEKLKELGRWTESSRAIGLPKVVHRKAAVGKKEKAPKPTAEAGAPGAAPTAEGAAPATGKAPAAGGKAPAPGAKGAAAAPAAGKKEAEKKEKKG